MSRKNKNGGRRNYSPRTYSRDFLRPTPIERAIQEVQDIGRQNYRQIHLYKAKKG